jgi:uncharacterized protein YoaH (UPF0181 family)
MRPTIGTAGTMNRPARADACSDLHVSCDQVAALVEQQAALRRVATVVARAVSPAEVFAVVAEEMARCLKVANVEPRKWRRDRRRRVLCRIGCARHSAR